MSNEKMFQEESVWKVLVKTSIPTMITMMIVIVYNMADIYFIGKTGDTFQVAAISLATPVFTVLSALGTLLGSGGCSSIAIANGKQDEKQVKQISAFCCYMAVLIGVVYCVVMLLAMNPVLDLLGTSEGTREFTKTYITIFLFGAPATLLGSAAANIVRAEGAVKTSMFGSLSGSLVNIILDPILILGLNMGVAGAALATVIGNVITVVFFMIYFKKKATRLTLDYRYFTIKREISLKVLSLGLPTAVGVLLSTLSSILSNRILLTFGETAIAAMGVAGKLGMIVTMLQMAVCTGMQPVLAYNFGSGNLKRLMDIVKKTALTTIILGTALTIICFLIRNAFVSAFINDQEVINYGGKMVTGTMVAGPIVGLYYVAANFLQATSRPSFATILSMLRQGLIFIPILYILSRLAGLNGIIFAHPAADILSVLIGGGLCVIQYKNNIVKQRYADTNEKEMNRYRISAMK